MDYLAARRNMVESQLRTNQVTGAAIVTAFENLPRERFVPEHSKGFAYVDEDLPLGGGRYLMEPMVLARLLQAAEPQADDVALEVGCTTGYATALLSRLTATVVALESNAAMVRTASELLAELEVDNVLVVQGNLAEGYRQQAPYDLILVGGAVEEPPQKLLEQLGDGGRLVAVLRESEALGRGTLWRRDKAVISMRRLFDAATPLLPGFERKRGFVF